MLASIEGVFNTVVEYAVLLLEGIGVAVLVFTAVKCVVMLFRDHAHVKLELAEGISLALSFKLGSEVLRTVVVRTWSELAILGAVMAIRAAITFLLHWEIKNERQSLSPEDCTEKEEPAQREASKPFGKPMINQTSHFSR